MAEEETRQQLHKNVESNIEQVLATMPQLYGQLPPITKTIQVRRTRHAGHCWRSKDELISDVLQWTPTHGRAKAGRPAQTYIQQLCEDTGCNPEDLPKAMNDREKWRERVRDIHAGSTNDDVDIKVISSLTMYSKIAEGKLLNPFYRFFQIPT